MHGISASNKMAIDATIDALRDFQSQVAMK